MALSNDRIRKWSERGDPIHAGYSYQMVRESLATAKLNNMSYTVYPQGSYANKTNISSASDVDMVIALKSAFYPDKTELSPPEWEEYAKYFERASITWHEFREVVVAFLRSHFFVTEGSKCVRVRSNFIRLPLDVLICLDHRYYQSFPSFAGQIFTEGVQFYASGDRKIVNYPKRHISACARKDNWTNGAYRRVVRIAKNARNKLSSEDGTGVGTDTAPSYFLESLLWNVPDERYGGNIENTYRQVVEWLNNDSSPLGQMDFPSRTGKLFRYRTRHVLDQIERAHDHQCDVCSAEVLTAAADCPRDTPGQARQPAAECLAHSFYAPAARHVDLIPGKRLAHADLRVLPGGGTEPGLFHLFSGLRLRGADQLLV